MAKPFDGDFNGDFISLLGTCWRDANANQLPAAEAENTTMYPGSQGSQAGNKSPGSGEAEMTEREREREGGRLLIGNTLLE